jgi:hypothetical protein
LLLAFAFPAGAADRLVFQTFSSERRDPELEEVLYLALGVELSNAGYSSSRVGREASHLLEVVYEARGAQADLRLIFSRTETPREVLAEVTFVLHLDSGFDAELAAALGRLLELAAVEAPGAEAANPEIGGLFSSDLVTRKALLRTERTVRLETAASGGAAPFFGDFSEYAGYGAFGAAQAGVLFLKPAWSISAGARFTLAQAILAEGVGGGPVVLTTGGINLQYGLGAAQRIKLAVCASGGAAVITLAEAGLSKTVPYADAGVQAGFPVGKDLFLGGDLRFLAVFDQEVTILGAVVALSIGKEF